MKLVFPPGLRLIDHKRQELTLVANPTVPQAGRQMFLHLQEMSPDLESVLTEIEEKLLTLKAPDLFDSCVEIGVVVGKKDKAVPRKLRRLILQCVETEEVTSREECE